MKEIIISVIIIAVLWGAYKITTVPTKKEEAVEAMTTLLIRLCSQETNAEYCEKNGFKVVKK